MAICHLSSSFSFSSSSTFCPHFLRNSHCPPLLHLRLLDPRRRSPSPPHCSVQKRSSKKGRPSRASKTNEELCGELREFAASFGLPGDRVPSLNELTENGRKDLANIVRRRGYKAVAELLGLPTKRDILSLETSSTQRDSDASIIKIDNSESEEMTTSVPLMCSSSSDPTMEEKIVVPDDNANITMNENAELQEVMKGVSLRGTSSNDPTRKNELNIQSNGAILATNHSQVNQVSKYSLESLQFELAKFIQSGELDTLEDDGNSSVDVASKVQEQPNQAEINHLKLLLHQKESELAHLKQLIEHEKISLYNLQAKSKAEVVKVQSNVAEKDAQLHIIEENLSGLKEIYIEFYANAQIVEVAGSFNGWQYHVTMDPHPQSEATVVERSPLLWSTILWLYPGVYEIKFIVDGHWRIDSQREIVTSGNITNNVLRVS